ncbi:hypothetical protein N9F34_01295 [Alphaproteobacteria bacterium]|nr:hypothetical protein [Alphaproteobacteria bacterium]
MTKYTTEKPSERWKELVSFYRRKHDEGEGVRSAQQMFTGMPRQEMINRLLGQVQRSGARTLLDYGSGKGVQWKLAYNAASLGLPGEGHLKNYLGLDVVHCYDPGYRPFSMPLPMKYDGVICLDVLEHCPESDLDWILDHIFGYANYFVLANIACYPSKKILPNGENAHYTIQSASWWEDKIMEASAQHSEVKYLFVCEDAIQGKEAKRQVCFEG